MSYKPDESVLLAYVYNELGAEDRAKLEQYLIEHPETKKELEEIKVTRSLLGKWPDQEVVEPSFVFDNPKVLVSSGSAWNSKLLQSIIGMAASIALLMMVGYFTNFQLSKNNEGWNVSMGVPKQEIKPDTSPILTEENGDLLVANLENVRAVESTDAHENAEHDDHHHDFPWLIVLLCIGVFVMGLFVGRLSKERK